MRHALFARKMALPGRISIQISIAHFAQPKSTGRRPKQYSLTWRLISFTIPGFQEIYPAAVSAEILTLNADFYSRERATSLISRNAPDVEFSMHRVYRNFDGRPLPNRPNDLCPQTSPSIVPYVYQNHPSSGNIRCQPI